MRRILVILAVTMVLVAGIPALVPAAEEELFDTKAAAVHLEKGIAHLKNGKYEAAIKELEDAADINPDAEAYYYLGYAYYMKGRKGDAESRKRSRECFDKAYELNPAFTPGRFKPADAQKAVEGITTQGSTKPEAVQPSTPAPSEPSAEPVAPQSGGKASGEDNPSQQTPPIKSDK